MYISSIGQFNVLSGISLWDYLCRLDEAQVFRFMEPDHDFYEVNRAPTGHTPPPEEDTTGAERFCSLISLDLPMLEHVVLAGNLLLDLAVQYCWPSGDISKFIDGLIRQSPEWLDLFIAAFLDDHDQRCFRTPLFWRECLEAADPAVFMGQFMKEEEQKEKELRQLLINDKQPELVSIEETPEETSSLLPPDAADQSAPRPLMTPLDFLLASGKPDYKPPYSAATYPLTGFFLFPLLPDVSYKKSGGYTSASTLFNLKKASANPDPVATPSVRDDKKSTL